MPLFSLLRPKYQTAATAAYDTDADFRRSVINMLATSMVDKSNLKRYDSIRRSTPIRCVLDQQNSGWLQDFTVKRTATARGSLPFFICI